MFYLKMDEHEKGLNWENGTMIASPKFFG
jgi:hypothetical protein